jgi:hypothetical protein
MAVDYFAHAVFGVELDEEDQDHLNGLYAEIRDKVEEEEGDFLFVSEVCERLHSEHPDLLPSLQEKYKSGPGTYLMYTGSEDERPGRCAAPAETWLLGIGMYGALSPEPDKKKIVLPDEFIWKSDWHTWVEAG